MKKEDDLAIKESVQVSKQNPVQSGRGNVPLLYQKREYLISSSYIGRTTSCEKTEQPKDYGPDD